MNETMMTNQMEQTANQAQNQTATSQGSLTTSSSLMDGFEIVTREYHSVKADPIITFKKDEFYVNAVAIQALPDTNHIQLLINPSERKLILKPCSFSEKDCLRWCFGSKRSAAHIPCKIFWGKLSKLLGWDAYHRYRCTGELIEMAGMKVLMFDLRRPEVLSYEKVSERPNTEPTPSEPMKTHVIGNIAAFGYGNQMNVTQETNHEDFN